MFWHPARNQAAPPNGTPWTHRCTRSERSGCSNHAANGKAGDSLEPSRHEQFRHSSETCRVLQSKSTMSRRVAGLRPCPTLWSVSYLANSQDQTPSAGREGPLEAVRVYLRWVFTTRSPLYSWTMYVVLPILSIATLLFIWVAASTGAGDAWDLLATIKSADEGAVSDADPAWLRRALSVVGYLLIPALFGAFVSAVVETHLTQLREYEKQLDRRIAELDERSKPPAPPNSAP